MTAELEGKDSLRIDKWLWHARFCKTRAIAQTHASGGRIRLNGQRIEKPGTRVKPGDIVTLIAGRDVVVVRILGLGVRRGPASEAQSLYEMIEDA
jgi:ribosome-associated heat shock protein Hsp15